MKNLSLLLLASALLLMPLRVSAMVEAKNTEEEKKSEVTNLDEEVTRETTKEENKAFIEESKKQGNPDFSSIGVIKRTSSESSQEKGSLNLSGEPESLEEESLFDLGVLEQRLEKAREVVAELTGKRTAIEEEELQSPFQEWSELYERYQKAASDFSKQENNNNNIGPIQQQLIEAKLGELVEASGEVVKVLKQSLEKFTPDTTRSNAADLKIPGPWSTWKAAIDAQDFSTTPNQAVFWTGRDDDPVKCNLRRSAEYATRTGKKTLESTPGGGWLDDFGFHQPDCPLPKGKIFWSTVSKKFVQGASGHVVAFVLEKNIPSSTYRREEKPSLLKNENVFLSEVVSKNHSPFLTAEAEEALENAKGVETSLYKLLNEIRALWERTDWVKKKDYSLFRQEEILNFLSKARSKSHTELIEEQSNQLPEQLDLFASKVKGLSQTWASLFEVLEFLQWGDIAKAQTTQQSNVHESLEQAEEITTVSKLWKQEYEGLQEAVQFLDYQIFKTHRDKGDNKAAQWWKKACRKSEEDEEADMLERGFIDFRKKQIFTDIFSLNEPRKKEPSSQVLWLQATKPSVKTQDIWKSIWAPGTQRAYKHYSLPEEILGATHFEKTKQENKKSFDKFKPERLEEELAAEGKRLFREACLISEVSRAVQPFLEKQSEHHFNEDFSQERIMLPSPTSLSEEEIEALIRRESHNLTPLNQERWEARILANEWIKKAAEVARRLEELKQNSQEKIEMDEKENDLASIDQSTLWDKMTLAPEWNAKFSVVASKIGSTLGDKMLAVMNKKKLPINLEIPTHPTEYDLKEFNKYAEQAIGTWEELVKKAPHFPERKELWLQSDRQGIKYWKEQQLEEERESLATTRQEDWERETQRWRLQREASHLAQETQVLKKEISTQEEERTSLESKLARKRLELTRAGKIEDSELEKLKTTLQEKEQLFKKTELDLQTAQNKASKAYDTWLRLAQQEKSLINAQDPKAKTDAEQLLYESDTATNQLWNEVKKRYEERKLTNLEDLELIDEAERRRVKEAFIKKINDLPLDQHYPLAMKREALRAAREKLPEAYGILEQHTQKKVEPSFVQANQKALHYFAQEERRLQDIEALWMGIIEAKNRKLLLEQAEAAQAYYEGTPKLWEELPLEAKEHYNNAIDQQNKETQTDREERLQLAQTQSTKAHQKAKRLKDRAWRTPATQLEAALKKATAKTVELMILQLQEERGNMAIAWAQKTPEERKAQIESLLTKADKAQQASEEAKKQGQEAKDNIFKAWKSSASAWKEAHSYSLQAAQTLQQGDHSYFLWEEAAEKMAEAAGLYASSAKEYAAGNSSGKGRGDDLNYAAESTLSSAQAQTAAALWKAKHTEALLKGNKEEAIAKALKASQLYDFSAKEVAAGNSNSKERGGGLRNAASSTLSSAQAQAAAALWKSKYTEALLKGNKEEAALWQEAIAKALEASQLYDSSAKKHIAGNESDKERGDDLSYAAMIITFSAQKKAKAARWKSKQEEALLKRNKEEAALWQEAIAKALKVSQLYDSSAKKIVVWNRRDIHLVSASLSTSASAEAKAAAAPWKSKHTEALLKGNKEEAALWQEAINKALEASQLYDSSAKGYIAWNGFGKEGSSNLSDAASSTLSSAQAKAAAAPWKSKHTEALLKRNKEEAAFWKEAIAKALEASQLYESSAKEFAAGNDYDKRGGRDLSRAAEFTLNSAQAKAAAAPWKSKHTEALLKENKEEAVLWEEAINKALVASQLYESSAKEFAGWNGWGWNRWNGRGIHLGLAAISTSDSAKAKVEAAPWRSKHTEALLKGNKEEAALWEEAIAKALEASQLDDSSAKEFAAGNDYDKGGGWDLNCASSSAWNSAQAQAAAARWKSKHTEALLKGNKEETALWEEAIAKALEASQLFEDSQLYEFLTKEYTAGNSSDKGEVNDLNDAAFSAWNSAQAKAEQAQEIL